HRHRVRGRLRHRGAGAQPATGVRLAALLGRRAGRLVGRGRRAGQGRGPRPRRRRRPVRTPPRRRPRRARRPAGGVTMAHTVLVADDDRAIRESLGRALELEGYRVVGVDHGVQAVTRARRDAFDLLVLDVLMPGLDGLGVCRVLRADGNRVPVLMLTARVETPDRVAGLDAGADDYLPKPFELDELLARLRALLRRAAPVADDREPALSVGDLRLDP